MEEYSISSAQPKECCVTHRAFQPGDEFVTVLFEANGNYVRKDYSLEAWNTQPPENFTAMWRGHIPENTEPPRRSRAAVNELLLEIFDDLRMHYTQPDKLYILSLLLVRRRVMRLEETFGDEAAQILKLYSQFRDEYYQIPIMSPTPERQAEIQAELTDVLTGNEPQPPKKTISPEEEQTIQIWDPDTIELPEVEDLPPDLY
ncbi:MAG: hypothetical protein Q4C70_07240 [Planctomycetia bacterium]|nr:hypothetical protein [Planctomycetia bacterium]